MSAKQFLEDKKTVIAMIVSIVIIMLPICYSIINSVSARGIHVAQPFIERPDAKYENCVRETEYMRFHHWELLREIREDAVRYRKRGDIRIASCRECHPNRDRFCNQCHNAVNLTPDCWGCHYYPDSPEATTEDALVTETRTLQHQTITEPDTINGGRG